MSDQAYEFLLKKLKSILSPHVHSHFDPALLFPVLYYFLLIQKKKKKVLYYFPGQANCIVVQMHTLHFSQTHGLISISHAQNPLFSTLDLNIYIFLIDFKCNLYMVNLFGTYNNQALVTKFWDHVCILNRLRIGHMNSFPPFYSI